MQQAPSICQRAMEQTLQGTPNVEVMFDDIIVTGKPDAAHRVPLSCAQKTCGEEGGSREITQLDPTSCTRVTSVSRR